MTGPDGGLIGPFNAMVTAPKIGVHQTRLGAELRFGTSIERRLTEVAICTVGAHWKSEFEFWAHARMAVDHGVSPNVVDALANGRPPEFDQTDEATVHMVTKQLLESGRVDDESYAEAAELLGPMGMVELVSLIGYYCMISLTLNLFEIPLPEGETAIWGKQ